MKKVLSILLLSIICILSSCGTYLATYNYDLFISTVDSEKTESVTLYQRVKITYENDETDVFIENTEKLSTNIDKSYNYSYPQGSFIKTKFFSQYFTLSYSEENTGNEVYMLLLPYLCENSNKFPYELFPECDGYASFYETYLEDETKRHETLQTLYENGYDGIKKLTPENESITISYSEVCVI